MRADAAASAAGIFRVWSMLDERFSLAPDGSRLNYTLTITSTGTLTAPVTIASYRDWRPGVEIRAYECVPYDAGR